jgi:hypothetical protein
MTTYLTQTRFTAGEIDPILAGRLDAQASAEGCGRLRNLLVQPTGGVTRRPGLRLVQEVLGADRLIGIDLPGTIALVALSPEKLQVVQNGAAPVTFDAPWSAAMLRRVHWTRRGGDLLICHPEVPPHELVRQGGTWNLRALAFPDQVNPGGHPLSRRPFHRFAAANVSMQAVAGSLPAADPIPADRVVSLKASAPIFGGQHLFTRLRLRGRQVTITNIISGTQALGRTDEPVIDGQATYDWQEEALSTAHGWPVSMTFHQDRLVIGGTRDLPDRVWFSKTGRHLDFDPGTGLDDEAISFALTADRRQDIVALVPGRQLQLFTVSGEWIVKGSPITPSNVELELQTSVGSPPTPFVQPISVDGATLFIGATRRELREFLFTDAEQAYQAADLAVLARHLLVDPIEMAFDPGRRLLSIVRGDGRMAAVTLDRTSNVTAWSLLETAGTIRSACAIAGQLWLAVSLDGRTFIERLEDGLDVDHAIDLGAPTPTTTWPGLDVLAGRTVVAMNGGRILAEQVPLDGVLTTAEAATSLTCGMRYTHLAEALPLSGGGRSGPSLNGLHRPVRVVVRTKDTPRLRLDAGNGPRVLGGEAGPEIADFETRVLGWRRPLDAPPWRVEQDDPRSCTILAVTLETKVNR